MRFLLCFWHNFWDFSGNVFDHSMGNIKISVFMIENTGISEQVYDAFERHGAACLKENDITLLNDGANVLGGFLCLDVAFEDRDAFSSMPFSRAPRAICFAALP